MAGKVLVVTSGKGGVGKTTATANIGVALAMRGRRVLLIDADIGLRNLDVVMGLENRIVYDLVQVVEGTCKPQQAMIRDRHVPNLYLIPAAQTRDKSAVSPEQMKDLCQRLRPEFDYILIDSPAGIEQGFRNALAPADEAIVVTTPEVSAVRDADRVIGIVESRGLPSPGLVINRYRAQMVRQGDMMDTPDILNLLSVPLLGVVPEDDHIVVSTNKGLPAVHNPRSRAGMAFRAIAGRLEGEEVPETPLNGHDGFFHRLRRLIGLAGRG